MLPKMRVAVTRFCNMKCLYCTDGDSFKMENYDHDMDGYSMSRNEMLDLIAFIVECGCKDVHLTGGEPTLREDIVDIVRKISEKGGRVELNTNGLLLSDAAVSELKEAGLALLKVSLDSSNSAQFAHLTRTDTFSTVTRNIAGAASIMPVRLNTVVMKSNEIFLIPIIALGEALGVSAIHFLDLTYYPSGTNKDFWEREFVYLSDAILRDISIYLSKDFRLLDIYGCSFYEMHSPGDKLRVVLKEAEPTMRHESYCDHCPRYCHEGMFSLHLSAGGYLNICPDRNSLGINAYACLKSGREDELRERLRLYSKIFDEARVVSSFDHFCKINELDIKRVAVGDK